jgi:hypothetical protein
MIRTAILSAAAALVAAGTAQAQSTAPVPDPHDPIICRVRVRIEPAEQTLAARVEMRFPGTPPGPRGAADTLVFRLHGELWVDSVAVGGVPAPFTQEPRFWELDYALVANEVRVPLEGLDLSRDVTVRYAGPMHASRARSPSDYMRIDADGAALRGYFYSPWFPVRDEGMDPRPISFERVEIDTPEAFTAVFTGDRLEERVAGGRRVSTWRAPDLPPADAQLTARRYDRIEGEGVTLYALPDSASRAAADGLLGTVEAWQAFYRSHYGTPRGGAQLHVLEMPRFGDIASGNVIGIARDGWTSFDPGSWQGRTLAHEMVHAYVQVPTPSTDPIYALVIEGFPSYFHLPALEATLGTAWYRGWVAATDSAYVERRLTGRGRRGAQLPVEKPIDAITPDEIGAYKDAFVLNDRVPLFLDWVRRRLGDDAFFAWARELFSRETLSRDAFVASLAPRLGAGGADDLRLWLSTTEYPDRFRP